MVILDVLFQKKTLMFGEKILCPMGFAMDA
jgi:hypothetical protein